MGLSSAHLCGRCHGPALRPLRRFTGSQWPSSVRLTEYRRGTPASAESERFVHSSSSNTAAEPARRCSSEAMSRRTRTRTTTDHDQEPEQQEEEELEPEPEPKPEQGKSRSKGRSRSGSWGRRARVLCTIAAAPTKVQQRLP